MSRRIVLLGVAALLALLSAVAVVAYASGADRRAVEGKKGVWVLLATDAIPSGTTGAQIRSRRLVRQVLMPAETVPSGALTKLDATLDAKALNAPLQPDQMLLSKQFTAATSKTKTRAGLQVPASLMAVSVDMSMSRQVAGNVQRGDTVAVFVSTPRQPTKEDKQITFVLIPRAKVISVGESPLNAQGGVVLTPSASGSSSASPSPTPSGESLQRYVVTLAVSATQAQLLITGYNGGFLHLGLLGPGAKVTVDPSLLTKLPTPTPTPVESGTAG
jgi:pilus assembly protein CpaB